MRVVNVIVQVIDTEVPGPSKVIDSRGWIRFENGDYLDASDAQFQHECTDEICRGISLALVSAYLGEDPLELAPEVA